jgi:hypothetical protein
MLSFLEYLLESTGEAPAGVIFDGSNKAYVGIIHGKPITLSNDLVTKIKAIGTKGGYYYEGSGGDRKGVSQYFGGNSIYKGSWDDDINKTVKGYPIEYFYTLFTNTNVNKQKENLPMQGKTIFESILKNQLKFAYFKDRKCDEATLTKFLQVCSQDEYDFVKMSKLEATKQNCNKFLDAGEKLMWPKNWQDYPNKAGKLAKKVEDYRNQYLLDQKSGVYFMGSGHLLDLLKMKKSLKMIDGSKAN